MLPSLTISHVPTLVPPSDYKLIKGKKCPCLFSTLHDASLMPSIQNTGRCHLRNTVSGVSRPELKVDHYESTIYCWCELGKFVDLFVSNYLICKLEVIILLRG